MKKGLPLILMTSFSLFGQSTNPGSYCTAQYSDDFMPVPHAVTNVQLGTLTNNSGATQFAAPHYVFYSDLTAPSLTKGNQYSIAITHDDGTTIHGMAAWIDFNGDFDFDDANEKLGETLWPGNDTPDAGDTRTYSFTVPTGAVSGTTRLRVRVYEDDDYTFSGTDLPVLPCQFNGVDADWGETEDYSVTIVGGSSAGLTDLIDQKWLMYSNHEINVVSEEVKALSLIDLNGKRINQHQTRINLESLESGIYLLEVITANNERLVVQLFR